MCKIVSFYSNKGGTGKTTLTYNVGADLSFNYKKRVLLIDADSQMNLTASMFGLSDTVEYSEQNSKNWKEYLSQYKSVVDIIDDNNEDKKIFSYQKHRKKNVENNDLFKKNNNVVFDLLIGDENYFDFEIKINSYLRNYYLQKDAARYFSKIVKKIKELSENYDFILIDCSPSASSTLNAFLVLISNYFLCPLRCDFFSYQAIGRMQKIIKNWEEDLFRPFQTDADMDCIDMKEKFIGIVVSETKKNSKGTNKNKKISLASQAWTKSVNESIKSYTESTVGRNRTITKDEFEKIFPKATPFIITDETCNYTGVVKNIIDKAGIPLVLLNEEISKRYYEKNVLTEAKYKDNYEQYKKAISFISSGLIKLK